MDWVWIPSPDNLDSTARALTDAGGELKKRAGFEPITTLIVAASAIAVVSALRSLFADARYRGVLIDATKQPIEVREMPGWDRTQILIITHDGPQFHQFADGNQIEKILAALKGGGK
jgi:hypothetical protein